MRGSALVLAAVLAACSVSNPAPPGWRRTMQGAERSPRGAWVSVRLRSGGVVQGELLAVDGDRVYVERGKTVVPIRLRDIAKLDMSAYDSDNDNLVALTVLGTVSTLSHGFLLVISAPVWMLWGSATARDQDREGYEDVTGRKLLPDELRPWARFPQGVPEGYAP